MRLILTIIAIAVPADGVHGCGICMSLAGNALALPHPRAIEIAVATRRALDQGWLRAAPESSSANGWQGRQRSGLTLLKNWAEQMKSAPGQASCVIHVVLVDTAETCALHVRAGHVFLEVRPTGSSDVIVATTVPVLQALVARTTTWDQAVEREWIDVRRLTPTIDLAGMWVP